LLEYLVPRSVDRLLSTGSRLELSKARCRGMGKRSAEGTNCRFSATKLGQRTARSQPSIGYLSQQKDATRRIFFWDFVPAFQDFFASDFLLNFLRGELRKIASEKDYDRVLSDDEVELVRGEGFRVSMGKLKARSDYSEVVCYASDFMCINLGPSSLQLEVFNIPANCDITFFDRSVRLSPACRREQEVGDIVKVNAGCDVLKFIRPELDTFQLFIVSLKPRMPLLWHFDAETLEPKYCTSANLMSSRLQMAMDILVRMGRVDAIPEVIGAARSKDHFVRWSAISSVLCMDEFEGTRLLIGALDDSHPDVRNAAAAALATVKLAN